MMWYSQDMKINRPIYISSTHGDLGGFIIGFDLVNYLTYNVRLR